MEAMETREAMSPDAISRPNCRWIGKFAPSPISSGRRENWRTKARRCGSVQAGISSCGKNLRHLKDELLLGIWLSEPTNVKLYP